MVCTKCGARLMDTDRFCPKCGTKVIKEKRCSECGAVLRDGTKFCHKCGSPVDGEENNRSISQETLDIPIDAIEKNILSETAAEIRADRRAEGAPRRTSSDSTASMRKDGERGASTKSASSKSMTHDSPGKSVPSKSAASHSSSKQNVSSKKRASYREEEDWDDDDDWDDEEEGVDVITVMTAIVGCVLLVVIAVLGYHMYRQYMPKDYETEENAQDEVGEEDELPGQEMETGWFEGENSEPDVFTITVIHNVNVRDNPSTSGTNVLKVAQEGETYTSVGSVEGGQWYEILLEDGSSGYVFHEYVTVE